MQLFIGSKYKELIKILIEAPSPTKTPRALDVPIANLAGMLCLIKNGTNKVAPPIPTKLEIIEKIKPIRLEKILFVMDKLLLLLLILTLWVQIL